MTSIAEKLKACASQLGLLVPMFVAIAVCHAVGEFYPFSSFPMYSKFDDRTYLAFLRSADGEDLPTKPTVKMVSSQLKKRYGDELDELKDKYEGSHFDWTAEQKREAGEKTLKYLKEIYAPKAFARGKLDGLRLIDVRITIENGKLVKREEEVAQLK
jgi:hypothetical protein